MARRSVGEAEVLRAPGALGTRSTPPADLGEFVSHLEAGRKGEILGAAAYVFAARGYDAGSMRDIAERVGVSEPALYRHFPSKEALFVALLRAAGTRLRDETGRLIDGIEADGLRDQLVATLADRRRALTLFGPVLRTILSASAYNPTFLEEYRAVIVEPTRARVARKAAELDEAFGLPAEEAAASRDARVRALMALFVGYFASSVVLDDEPNEAVADAVLRLMLWER